MALFEFDTEEEAVQRANDTSMGLASCKTRPVICWMFRMLTIVQISLPRMSTEHGDCMRTSKPA